MRQFCKIFLFSLLCYFIFHHKFHHSDLYIEFVSFVVLCMEILKFSCTRRESFYQQKVHTKLDLKPPQNSPNNRKTPPYRDSIRHDKCTSSLRWSSMGNRRWDNKVREQLSTSICLCRMRALNFSTRQSRLLRLKSAPGKWWNWKLS